VNAVVGGGIFVLPAAVAGQLGAAGPLAYVVCGVALLLVTFSFAIAGSRVSRTFGTYVYVEAAFASFPGYLAGVLAWLSGALASAWRSGHSREHHQRGIVRDGLRRRGRAGERRAAAAVVFILATRARGVRGLGMDR
jgi:hypothetical protein